ncbi:hypothetical protein [Streptomyces sp. H27-D2]|uniref:hypothetical protein n=1 Tax=Streptomyces sp. H27-D2 TaxID=3046304 RepID=UPI002DBF4C8D|nr:hypothetical protein [Streptomyces sp. H27-D2]MEC4019835.1 hypothetical protein [Streptomyces sp. H27-D2]
MKLLRGRAWTKGGFPVPWIGSYGKKSGTRVGEHYRSAPGSKRQVTIAGMVVLLVWGIGGGHVTIDIGSGHAPAPHGAVVQPVEGKR